MQASTGVLVHRDLEIPSIELLLVITIHLLQIPIKHGDITICAYRVRRCREDRGRYIVGGLRLAEGDIPCEKVLQDRGRYIVGDLGLAEGEFAIMLGILIVI
ncbi:Hypothetical predicted protein [Pelobates cultripes]|uniref:Uncharacterized protein n=1 Tax=Pelobates cultripes TaxID=61616 RepID=A0AAD1RWL3_PELCU|nr:Hypothetical predicted protein [Pelobates cultripes]